MFWPWLWRTSYRLSHPNDTLSQWINQEIPKRLESQYYKTTQRIHRNPNETITADGKTMFSYSKYAKGKRYYVRLFHLLRDL